VKRLRRLALCLILTAATSLGLQTNVSAERTLTAYEISKISGVYSFEGTWKAINTDKAKERYVEVHFKTGSSGELVGETYLGVNDEGDLDWHQITNFRRISAEEWINEWKILTLDGSRCDVDRICIVSKSGTPLFSERLWQFNEDYTWMASYAVFDSRFSRFGHGFLMPPYTKISNKKEWDWWGGRADEPEPDPKVSPSPLPEGPPEQKGSEPNESVISDTSALKEKLLELKELVDEGLITEEDYEKVKNQLLEKM
jgi:hypothetical protein